MLNTIYQSSKVHGEWVMWKTKAYQKEKDSALEYFNQSEVLCPAIEQEVIPIVLSVTIEIFEIGGE